MPDLKKLSQTDLQRRLENIQSELRDHPQMEEIQRVLEDLQVHRIELELQHRELRDAHSELEEARDSYADLYDFAPIGYLTLDARGKILEINLTGARLLGTGRSGLIGHPLSTLVQRASVSNLFAHLKQVLRGPAKQVTELVMRPRREGDTPMEVRLESVGAKRRDGSLVCRTALIDETQRKQTERALAEHEAEERAVIETTTDGFWVVDESGRILSVNDAYVRRSGYSQAELLDMHVWDLDAAESAYDAQRRIERVKSVGNELFETRHRNRDGVIWPVEVNMAYWPAGGGRFFVFLRDISERNALEKQIIETSTAEQERIGLEIHDGIGQQLTAIAMLAKSLERGLEQDGQGSAANIAHVLVEHLQHALRDTRALAKGLSPIELGPEGLADALELLAKRSQGFAGMQYEFERSGSIEGMGETEAVHLYRIAQEAVHNASRHAEASHIHISLTGKDDSIVLSVSDDGKGIASGSDADSGLGMAIMHYRARVIGASLIISREPSGGTRVRCVWHRPD